MTGSTIRYTGMPGGYLANMVKLSTKYQVNQSLTPEHVIQLCVDRGTPEAWEEFVRRFQPVIGATAVKTARRFGLNCQEAMEDIIQETYLKITANSCAVLRSFIPTREDSAFGFMKTIALSVATDYVRRRVAIKRDTGKTASLDDLSTELAAEPGLNDAERNVQVREIDEKLREIATPRDRRIFWLYHRLGMTAKAIASLPGVGIKEKGVESVLQRILNELKYLLAPAIAGGRSRRGRS